MKRIKQKAWRLSLKLMWLAIVFLVSCRSNQEQKETTSDTPTKKQDSVTVGTNETQPLRDSVKDTEEAKPVAKPIKKKPIAKKDTINKPIRQDPGPVCKYGVIRKVTPVGDGN